MRNVFGIFINDIKGVRKNLIIFGIAIGVLILPALYAWFNLAANWDPYANTGELPFAICSVDKGFDFKGLKINAGDSIIDNLKKNDQMGWTFVDAEQAVQGTKNGEYYAAVIVPEDFSENLLSLVTGEFKQASLQYYVNEKINAIAPKITDKGVEAIEGAVDSAFVSKLTEAVASAMEVGESELDGKTDTILDQIKSTLKNAKSDIEMLVSSADLMISTLDSVDGMLKTVKEMKPVIKKTLSEAGVMVDDIKTSLRTAQNTSKQLVPTIENILHSMNSGADEVLTRLDDAFGDIEADPASAAAKLREAESIIQKKVSVNEELISIFESVNSNLGVDCSPIIKILEDSNSKSNKLITKIEDVCKKLDNGKTISDTVKTELDDLAKEIDGDLEKVNDKFNSIEKDIEKKLEGSYSSIDSMADFAQTLGSGTKQMDSAMENAKTMNKNLKDVFNNLKELMGKMDDKLDDIIKKLDNPGDAVSLVSLLRPIIQNPKSLGEFIANPVDYDRNSFFPVRNYGSAMSPFFSSLALWVGGVVLVAVFAVDLSPRDKKKFPTSGATSQYFGRLLTFILVGQFQALLIALGDMFFLQTQVENPFLFVFGCMISSLVYMTIIFSLTVTFSVIGKALAVIILVLQIAGSGGTFPIEVLPGPFRDLVPYLPFRYGVNALRETVGGADVEKFWKYIGFLLIFLVPALLIGLLLRKPCMKIFAFFNKKVEESDLII